MTTKHARVAEHVRQNPPPPDGTDRHHQVLTDARELFEMLGLVDPDGRELLPDNDGQTVVFDLNAGTPAGDDPNTPNPRRAAESTRRDRSAVPAGLRDLPPAEQPAKRAPRKPRTAPVAPAGPTRKRKNPTGKPPGPVPEPIDHGKPAGYRAHLRRGEMPVCDDCRDAYNADRADKGAKRRARGKAAAIAVELDVWFADAQRSPHATVRRAAAVALGDLMALRISMDQLARAERRAATPRPTETTGGPS
jgi:hypothetical protein